MIKHAEEFKRETARIALMSRLQRYRFSSDLAIGKSTLDKWVSQYWQSDLVAGPQADLSRGNERIRIENRVLREVTGLLTTLAS